MVLKLIKNTAVQQFLSKILHEIKIYYLIISYFTSIYIGNTHQSSFMCVRNMHLHLSPMQVGRNSTINCSGKLSNFIFSISSKWRTKLRMKRYNPWKFFSPFVTRVTAWKPMHNNWCGRAIHVALYSPVNKIAFFKWGWYSQKIYLIIHSFFFAVGHQLLPIIFITSSHVILFSLKVVSCFSAK